jgi:hypothetical protein
MEMAQIRKTVDELIADEKQKTEQSKARIAELKARQRADERKKDTHRKIVAGAILIGRVYSDPRFRRMVHENFNPAVTDPKHRAVIADLLDETAFDQARKAAANKTAIEAKEKEAATAAANTSAPAPAPPQQHERPPIPQGPSPAYRLAGVGRAPTPARPPAPLPPARPFKSPGGPPSGSAPA